MVILHFDITCLEDGTSTAELPQTEWPVTMSAEHFLQLEIEVEGGPHCE